MADTFSWYTLKHRDLRKDIDEFTAKIEEFEPFYEKIDKIREDGEEIPFSFEWLLAITRNQSDILKSLMVNINALREGLIEVEAKLDKIADSKR